MEWWQYLIYALATAFFGGVVTYLFTRLVAGRERKSREEDQLRSAVRSMLAEVEVNLKLAKQPFQNILVPFVTDIWGVHKGEILALPRDLQDTLYQVYVAIEAANALVQMEHHQQSYGLGYSHTPYKEKCGEIAEKAEEARELLVNWLRKEGVEVVG